MTEQSKQGAGEDPKVKKSNLQDHVDKILQQYHQEVQSRNEKEEQLCLKINDLEEKVRAQSTQLMMIRAKWTEVQTIFRKLQKELQEDAQFRAKERKQAQRYKYLFHEIHAICAQSWKHQASKLVGQSKGKNVTEPSLGDFCPPPEGLPPRTRPIPRILELHSEKHDILAPAPLCGLLKSYSQEMVPWSTTPPMTTTVRKKKKTQWGMTPSSDSLLSSGRETVKISSQSTPEPFKGIPESADEAVVSSDLGIRPRQTNFPPPEAVKK